MKKDKKTNNNKPTIYNPTLDYLNSKDPYTKLTVHDSIRVPGYLRAEINNLNENQFFNFGYFTVTEKLQLSGKLLIIIIVTNITRTP